MIKKLFLASALGLGAFYYGQTVIFQENFETAEGRNSWINTDRDGDGEKWEFDNSEVDSFTGYFATSWSWFLEAFTPDNTLTSNLISLPNNSSNELKLKFDIGAFDDEVFQEHYAVYVIPANSAFTGSETPVFEETLDAGYMSEAKHVTVDISSYAGQDIQLVFRHYDCTDLLVLMLDNIQIIESTKMAVSDSQRNDIQIYPNPTSDFIKINGLKNIENVRIFDMSGKMVRETQELKIDVKNLQSGQYILNAYSGKNVISKKFIKK